MSYDHIVTHEEAEEIAASSPAGKALIDAARAHAEIHVFDEASTCRRHVEEILEHESWFRHNAPRLSSDGWVSADHLRCVLEVTAPLSVAHLENTLYELVNDGALLVEQAGDKYRQRHSF